MSPQPAVTIRAGRAVLPAAIPTRAEESPHAVREAVTAGRREENNTPRFPPPPPLPEPPPKGAGPSTPAAAVLSRDGLGGRCLLGRAADHRVSNKCRAPSAGRAARRRTQPEEKRDHGSRWKGAAAARRAGGSGGGGGEAVAPPPAEGAPASEDGADVASGGGCPAPDSRPVPSRSAAPRQGPGLAERRRTMLPCRSLSRSLPCPPTERGPGGTVSCGAGRWHHLPLLLPLLHPPTARPRAPCPRPSSRAPGTASRLAPRPPPPPPRQRTRATAAAASSSACARAIPTPPPPPSQQAKVGEEAGLFSHHVTRRREPIGARRGFRRVSWCLAPRWRGGVGRDHPLPPHTPPPPSSSPFPASGPGKQRLRWASSRLFHLFFLGSRLRTLAVGGRGK